MYLSEQYLKLETIELYLRIDLSITQYFCNLTYIFVDSAAAVAS